MKNLFWCAWMLFAFPAFADDDEVTEHDIQGMRLQLEDAEARKELLARDPKSRAMHEEVSRLTGSETHTQEVYRLASEVLARISQEAGGDPEKMMMLLQEAQKNPEAFADRLTPEQKAAIRTLAAQIERSRR